MNRLAGALMDLLFPPKCLFCRKIIPAGGICAACREQWVGPAQLREESGWKCWVAMEYQGPVRDAILRFKFSEQPGYAGALGEILARCIAQEIPEEYDLITWVPVSPGRLKQRGYDQARLLAEAAAAALGRQAVATLKKPIDNPAQSSLSDADARKRNVRGAYTVLDPERVASRRVLLIDDIITTGSTLGEAAGALRSAGASSVVAAVLAQPPRENHTSEE